MPGVLLQWATSIPLCDKQDVTKFLFSCTHIIPKFRYSYLHQVGQAMKTKEYRVLESLLADEVFLSNEHLKNSTNILILPQNSSKSVFGSINNEEKKPPEHKSCS